MPAFRAIPLSAVTALYGQHSVDTGQAFDETAIDRAFYLTQGQPWLVNAIAREVVEEILHGDISIRVTPPQIDQAAETIILRRDTHIDSLLERLKEERVQRIIEPVLTGASGDIDQLNDDLAYCSDLG